MKKQLDSYKLGCELEAITKILDRRKRLLEGEKKVLKDISVRIKTG